jgi:hypothetical protein
VKGQWIDNAAKYDLYLAIQDNGIWASGDAGLTWPPTIKGGEGLNIEMQKHVPSPAESVVTLNFCGLAKIKSAEGYFRKRMERRFRASINGPILPARLVLSARLDIRPFFPSRSMTKASMDQADF